MDRYSFLVRLLPPLLHAGLARRTNIPITLIIPVFPDTPQAVVSLCTHLPRWSTSNSPRRNFGAKGKQVPTDAREQSHSLKMQSRNRIENFPQLSRRDNPQLEQT